MLEELSNPKKKTSISLISGYAGTGKTTLVKSLAFMLAKEFNHPILMHIPGTPLNAKDLGPVINESSDKRVVVIIHDAAEYIQELRQFCFDLKKMDMSITIILEERTNQWKVAIENIKDLEVQNYKLASLSNTEIEAIIEALIKYDALGRLKSHSKDECIDHFTTLADKELLVALRELTTGTRFDEIIHNEYNKIPSVLAKDAYAYVSALGQIDLYIRQETLLRLVDCEVSELSQKIFNPTIDILLTTQLTGSSRHNIGYRVRVRHPIIASIIFSLAAHDDEQKLKIINSLIDQLDPGYREDNQILNSIVKRKDLVQTLASEENQRSVYEHLSNILPNNGYVYQHRSILERNLGSNEYAIKFARKAVDITPSNYAFQNTLGLALESAAREESNNLRKLSLLSEASSLFDKGVVNDPDSPFGYLGQVYILRQKYEMETIEDRKKYIKAKILSILDLAREMTESSSVIEQEYAKEQEILGNIDEAISIVKMAIEKQPNDERMANLLIHYLLQKGEPKDTIINEAIQVAKNGVRYNPTSWRLYRHLGRIYAMDKSSSKELIAENYEAAIRHNRKEPSLYVELASILYERQDYESAKEVFMRANQLPITSQSKHKIYVWYSDDGGRKLFKGEVSHISGGGAYAIAIPDNFEVFFWRTQTKAASLMQGDKITFYVGFNCRGPIAEIKERI